jgi:hypothetical protein
MAGSNFARPRLGFINRCKSASVRACQCVLSFIAEWQYFSLRINSHKRQNIRVIFEACCEAVPRISSSPLYRGNGPRQHAFRCFKSYLARFHHFGLLPAHDRTGAGRPIWRSPFISGQAGDVSCWYQPDMPGPSYDVRSSRCTGRGRPTVQSDAVHPLRTSRWYGFWVRRNLERKMLSGATRRVFGIIMRSAFGTADIPGLKRRE